MCQDPDLPNYQGCLNLLHAIYCRWWLDALRRERLLADLADWTDQPVAQVLSNSPIKFRSSRKSDLLPD